MLKLEPAARTDVGRKRSNNQDYLGDLIFKSGRKYGAEKLNERGYLFAVADGMGGYAGGEVASELAITTLFEHFYNGASSGDLGTDLSDSIRAANLKVHTEASGSGRPQMGTTLTSVLVKGNKAIFGNVGDSRTYLIRQGIPERVTHDHSLVQDQIDAGVLTPEQAERSAIKNFITRAIGHRDEVESDLFEREIQKDDVLLLCSDGLHGLVKEIELGSIVATAPSMDEAAQTLVDLANERGGHDNISVMLIRVEEVGEALPPILNGREPVYNTNRSLFSQTTEPLGAVTVPSNGTSLSDRLTVPSPNPVGAAVASASPYAQPTMPLTSSVSETTEKTGGGKGLLWAALLLIVIAAAAAAFFIFFNNPTQGGATQTPQPAVQPTSAAAATPTVTAAPTPTTQAPTTAAALPTVTSGPSSTTSSNATSLAPGTSTPASGASVPTTSAVSGALAPTTTAASSGASSGVSGGRPNPTEDAGSTNSTPIISTSTSFEPCQNAGFQDNLSCWKVNNLGTIEQVAIRLTRANGTFIIKLVPQDQPGVPTIDLTLDSKDGLYKSPTATKIAKGKYSLQITRQGAASPAPEAYTMKFGATDLEAWAQQNVRVNQQGQAMLIEVDNKP